MGTVMTPVVVSDGLVTLEEAKEYLAIDIAISDDAINDRIKATSRWVERHCGRRFSLFTAKSRTIWPNVKGSLDLIDLLATPAPTVYVDSSNDRTYPLLIDATTYELLPFPDDDEETARYQEIAYVSPLLGFDQKVPTRVTGSWGYVEDDGRAPYDVRLATLMMLARWWKRKETPSMLIQMPALGFHRMLDNDPDAVELLKGFIHPRKRRVVQ